MLQQLKEELASAKNRMKQFVDRKRSEKEFSVGEKEYLRLRYPHLKSTQGPVSKLSPRCYGPLPIVAKIGRVAYHLQLLESSQIHLMFYVSLLKKSMGTQPVSPTLPVLPKEASKAMEPEAILDRHAVYKQGAPLIQELVK